MPPRPTLPNAFARRLARLVPGCFLLGVGIALMVWSDLGLSPWDVLHQGLADRTGIPIGTTVVLVGAVVLLLWLPLRQRLGLGTVVNVLFVGLSVDAVLAVLGDEAGSTPARWAALATGTVVCGVGTGLYISAGFGPGPRDGLMTGLAARWPRWSLRVIRTGIELTALSAGWALGGTVGVGTVAFAVLIGPLVQLAIAVFSRPEVPPSVPVTPGMEVVPPHGQ